MLPPPPPPFPFILDMPIVCMPARTPEHTLIVEYSAKIFPCSVAILP